MGVHLQQLVNTIYGLHVCITEHQIMSGCHIRHVADFNTCITSQADSEKVD